MPNQKTGRFLAQLRKEQNLTQEQLAEIIGVSNRSISRWENGNTLPDYSLLQHLAIVLGVTLSDLLAGQRLHENVRTEDCVRLALELVQQEAGSLRRSLNRCFGAGLAFLICGRLFQDAAAAPLVFFWICTALGLGFLFAGFWMNNRQSTGRKAQLSILLTEESLLHIKTAQEMLYFSKKYQTGHKNQHHRAFDALAAALMQDEFVRFAFIADSCTVNGSPGPWHISAVLTNKRFLFSGEIVRGRLMTAIETESYDLRALKSLRPEGNKLMLQLDSTVIKMDGRNWETVAAKLQSLCSF